MWGGGGSPIIVMLAVISWVMSMITISKAPNTDGEKEVLALFISITAASAIY